MTKSSSVKTYAVAVLLLLATGGGLYLWKSLQRPMLPEGFAAGNGRIEATEVDITTKIGGRLAAVHVREGDSVRRDQALAQIDTRELEAQLRRAEAEVRRARQERRVAVAVIAQRRSERSLAEKDLHRTKGLYENDNTSLEELQRAQTAVQTARATLAAAEAQLANAAAAIEAAIADTEVLKAQIEDTLLKAPISGRVLYRLAEPGEVLSNGGKVLTVIDPLDVYMTIFLPTHEAVRLALDAEARVVLDGLPEVVIPGRVSFVAPRAQFTPREVETRTEREKLMFRIKVQVDPETLQIRPELSKSGIPGMAYVRLAQDAQWPPQLQLAARP